MMDVTIARGVTIAAVDQEDLYALIEIAFNQTESVDDDEVAAAYGHTVEEMERLTFTAQRLLEVLA